MENLVNVKLFEELNSQKNMKQNLSENTFNPITQSNLELSIPQESIQTLVSLL